MLIWPVGTQTVGSHWYLGFVGIWESEANAHSGSSWGHIVVRETGHSKTVYLIGTENSCALAAHGCRLTDISREPKTAGVAGMPLE